jgi:hypothetical protein
MMCQLLKQITVVVVELLHSAEQTCRVDHVLLLLQRQIFIVLANAGTTHIAADFQVRFDYYYW